MASPRAPRDPKATNMDFPERDISISPGSKVAVIGRGMMGNALYNRLAACGYSVTKHGRDFGDSNGLLEADILFLAVPEKSLLQNVVPKLAEIKFSQEVETGIRAKPILVDLTNKSNIKSPGTVMSLCNELGPLGFRVIKGFNSVSAYDLIYHKPRKVLLAGTSDWSAMEEIMKIASRMGLQSQVIGMTVADLVHVENYPVRFFPGWGYAAAISGTIWCATVIYASLRYLKLFCCGSYPLDMWPLYILNKTFCWTSIWVFAFIYLLGGAADLARKPLAHCFVNMLSIRKQLSIVAYGLLIAHILVSLLIFGPQYYGKFYSKSLVNNSTLSTGIGPVFTYGKLLGKIEASMLLGVIGFMIFSAVAVASVGTIAADMSWKEWHALNRWGGLVALALGAVHVVVMGYAGWSKIGDTSVHKGLPSITFVSSVPVLLVIVFRLVVALIPQRCKPASRVFQKDTVAMPIGRAMHIDVRE